jgi:hypothetical protein
MLQKYWTNCKPKRIIVREISLIEGRGVFYPGVSSPRFSNGFAAGDADPLRIRPG